jgi:hypothetical protein
LLPAAVAPIPIPDKPAIITVAESPVAENTIVVEVANPSAPHRSQDNAIIGESQVAVAYPITKYDIANPIATRAATVPTAISGVVAVHKLAAFPASIVTAPAVAAISLPEGRRGHS